MVQESCESCAAAFPDEKLRSTSVGIKGRQGNGQSILHHHILKRTLNEVVFEHG
jgi:hypothetical protein